jgi:hypothetical protein
VSDAYLADHARHALGDATCILGIFVDGGLRGVVELYDDGPRGCAEAAFVVAPEWRRRRSPRDTRLPGGINIRNRLIAPPGWRILPQLGEERLQVGAVGLKA